MDKTRFEELIQKGEFLEWAEVYGNYYGTRRSFIDERLARGDDVLVDVDVHYRDYDFLIVNEDLEDSIDKLRAIIIGSHCRMRSRADHAKSIMATFGGMDGKDS